ncbi:unnamed protein product [Blepharisma stoltei]|uniref:3CxxC-type domain-containing protein n=1 Tax=Blepharisma stoltei TaxID=1481888 RepID=A0AAU9IUL5_9CILI|nr:unnamed protein product [Blepharisma stoltei]
MRSSRGRYRFSRLRGSSRLANPSTRYYRIRNSDSQGEQRSSNNLERGRNGRRPRRYSSRYRNGQSSSSRLDDGCKTQYQGPWRVYGYFRCEKCKRTWSSGNSWANCGQQCLKCNINVYPHLQTPLIRSKTSKSEGPEKAHKSDLCEKCKQLGYSCLQYIEELKSKRNALKYTEELKRNSDPYVDDD